MGGGMGYSASNQQSSAATGTSNSGFDNSGFVVNFGNGNSTAKDAGGIPTWVLAAVAIGAVLWLTRKR